MVRCSLLIVIFVVSLVSRASFSRWLPRLVVQLCGCKAVYADSSYWLYRYDIVISAFSFLHHYFTRY